MLENPGYFPQNNNPASIPSGQQRPAQSEMTPQQIQKLKYAQELESQVS